MLSARSNNLQNVNDGGQLKARNKPNLISNNKLKNSTNLKKGLSVGNTNTIGSKPRPLQLSTNTIHAQQSKIPISLKSAQKTGDGPIKKKTQTPKADKIIKNQAKSDENDVGPYAQESYNPLLDLHPMDEELYQKVLKLEIADDGLPVFKSDEPFDF